MWDLVFQEPAARSSQQPAAASGRQLQQGARFGTSAAECGTWWFSIQQPAAASGRQLQQGARFGTSGADCYASGA